MRSLAAGLLLTPGVAVCRVLRSSWVCRGFMRCGFDWLPENGKSCEAECSSGQPAGKLRAQ